MLNSHGLSINEYHQLLFSWGAKHRRVFPWRETKNAFHILIAELMLRRTRASQVTPVYIKFTQEFPTPNALASADLGKIKQLLFPLGLAWRVPAFQELAKVLEVEFRGQVPEEYNSLIKLPGVGDYVASAVRVFSYHECDAIIDTNTVRVTGRIFGIRTSAESRRQKDIREMISSLVNCENSADYSYALLDLAAQICIATVPRCIECPLLPLCSTGKAMQTST